MSLLGGDDLIASYFTLTGAPVGAPARFPFAARVAAAAGAGFGGVGLLADDYLACRDAGARDADLVSAVADCGITVPEIEFLYDWAYDDERGKTARDAEDVLYAMADAFGSDHVNVGDIQPPGELPGLDAVAERFADICDRAAGHGLRVALEFLPWTGIPDLATAWEIVRRADRTNGGIDLDAWHWFRGGGDPELLRAIPPGHIVCVQIDDAGAPQGPLPEDTMLRRRLPGEGDFDLVGLLRLLDAVGVDVPVSVEVMSTRLQALPVDETARRAYDATMEVLRAARA